MQKNSVIAQIYDRIIAIGHDEMFIVNDFLDLGEYHTVRKSLLRLEKLNYIKKVMRGVFYYPRYSKLIEEFEVPSPNKVAETLARKFNWTIAPCGDTALNLLGLSTQVPAKWIYISDGPYREFNLVNINIVFKHVNNRNISGISTKTATIIQALKEIGKDNVSEKHIDIIKSRLSESDKSNILMEGKQSSMWIYNVLKLIC